MGWRAIAVVLTVVFSIVVIQDILADPMISLVDTFVDVGPTNTEYYNGEELMRGYLDNWFWMGIVAIAGVMVWAVARVVRREFTRQGGL